MIFVRRRRKVGVLLLAGLAALWCSCKAKEETPTRTGLKGELKILHAASLSVPLRDVTAEFQKNNPELKVTLEAGPSLELARRIAEGQQADLFFSADYALINDFLIPKAATWSLKFARNYVTIAFTPKSKYADVVNSFNWYDFLVKPEVKVGHADPNLSPAGYRALIAMQLAERYYDKKRLGEDLKKNCPATYIRPKTTDLLAMLESGQLDYAWVYRSEAKQRGLKAVILPPEVDLSSGSFTDKYKQAKVEVAGATIDSKRSVQGEPTLYGVTIPTKAASPKAALDYLLFLLSPAGKEIFKKNAQMQLATCEANDKTKLPAELVKFCEKPKEEKEQTPPSP